MLRVVLIWLAMNRPRSISLLILVAAVVAGVWPAAGSAATQPRLGTATGFAALAGSTITNTGPTVITGDLGLHPGTAVTGFPPGSVIGTQHVTDAVALQAKNDLITAYTDAATSTSTSDLTGQDLGGKNLVPGVYTFSSAAQLTGPLTLSGNGVFIFQVGSTLTTASASSVLLTGGAQACAVFWQIGTSATLGTATQFQGTLMALSSITLTTGASLTGRALARNGALTLDTNNITVPSSTCTIGPAPTPTPTPVPTVAPPTPAPTPVPIAGTPTPAPVSMGFPNTGGGPPQDPGTPWWPVVMIGGLGALALIGIGLRQHLLRER